MNKQHVEHVLEMWAKLKGHEVCHDSECYFVNNGWHYHIDIDNMKYAPKIDYTLLYKIIKGLGKDCALKYVMQLEGILGLDYGSTRPFVYIIKLHTATVDQILEALYEVKP